MIAFLEFGIFVELGEKYDFTADISVEGIFSSCSSLNDVYKNVPFS